MEISETKKRDFLLWPVMVVPSMVLIIFNIMYSFEPDLDLFLILISLISLALWMLIISIGGLFTLWHGFSKMTLSLVLSVFLLWPTFMLLTWLPIGDYVHLAVVYPEYERKIASAPETSLEFDWGTFGLLGGANRKLVYDPSGKCVQENRIKDNHLRKTTCKDKNDICMGITTQKLWKHFYLVTEWH